MANQGDSQGPRAGGPDAGTPGVEEMGAGEQGVEGIGAAEVHARKKRIGVLGGTFDPIHYAHLALAEDVYHELKLARIIFVPAGQPRHKMGYRVTPVEQRVAMLEQAIAALPEPYRDAYVLADVEGVPDAEISELLSLSIPAVKGRLHRARLELRDALAPLLQGDRG